MGLVLDNRPFSLDKMIGQRGILKEMKKRAKTLNFPQVSIFEGESGSGKSTMAFIIAAMLNCNRSYEDGKVCPGSPIYVCPSCADIQAERFRRDVHYLNAANMSKDDVLAIENIISICPMYDKNQIVIIDEAQELSSKAFGAALNILEKKRKDIYFILCTMDVKKIHKAILSRGEVYKFKAVPFVEIAEHLLTLIKDKEIPEIFITEGIFTISDYAHGSVRQAIQYLERCLEGEFWTKEDILSEFGFVDDKTLYDLIFMLLNRDQKFFTSISKVDLEEFYYQSWQIILNAITQSDNEKYDSIRSKINVFELLDVYQKSYQPAYFRKQLFLSCLISYYGKEKAIPVIPVRTRKIKET